MNETVRKMFLSENEVVSRRQPSQEFLDEVADRKMDGGYKLRMNGKSNVCPGCGIIRARNGTCNGGCR